MQDESVTKVNDDGTVIASGQDAIQEMLRRGLAQQQQRRRVLAKLTPLELHRLERRLTTGCAHVASRPRVGDAVVVPRRTNGPSGRPRSSASRSSARSGDSGSDDGPSSRPRATNPGLAATIVGRPSAESDAALRRHFEHWLAAETPGVSWSVQP